MTPPDSAEREPATTYCAMTLERFDGVGRAAGIITARRGKQGTERHLVRAYEQNEKRSHQVSLDPVSAGLPADGDGGPVSSARHATSCATARSTSKASAENAARYASGRIRMTTSAATSVGSRRVLESSRKRRFTRLRATAD